VEGMQCGRARGDMRFEAIADTRNASQNDVHGRRYGSTV
jgi:hypothetical protein